MTQPAQSTWATTDDVATFTGTEVTQAQLMQASATIDMHAARTYEDVTRVGTRDQYWMKLAVCFQAAWLTEQPDMFVRMDILSLGSASRTGRGGTSFGPDALLIAPNAKKALSRVSWLKSRSLHVQSPFTDGYGVFGTDPLSSGSDGLYSWESLE
ncbi:hypothetical protein AB0383_20600 [Amycolatopsis sp. NPDC051373]|uniref:hypothetical protein n=1 Tax=Amycolatopsis sp. NPDC051373 TaxID=3155801 RepID=UPI00344C68C7